MRVQLPLTIEILGLKDGMPVVVERVIGATLYLEEAKRISQHLLSIADAEAAPTGYRDPQPRSRSVYEVGGTSRATKVTTWDMNSRPEYRHARFCLQGLGALVRFEATGIRIR
jgi:hypothetical protein